VPLEKRGVWGGMIRGGYWRGKEMTADEVGRERAQRQQQRGFKGWGLSVRTPKNNQNEQKINTN